MAVCIIITIIIIIRYYVSGGGKVFHPGQGRLLPTTLLFVNARTLMGCPDPLEGGSAYPTSVHSVSVASYLCHFLLMCGCTFR